MRQLAIAAAAMVAFLAAATGGVLLTAQFWMVRWLDSVLSQPGVVEGSHGAVRYSLWTGHLVIDDLAVTVISPVPQAFRAAHLEAEGVGPRFLIDLACGKTALRLKALRGRQVAAEDGALHASIAALEIDDPAYDGGSAAEPPQVFFRRLHLAHATFGDRHEADGSIGDAVLTMDGTLGKPTAGTARIAAFALPPLPLAKNGTLGPISVDLDSKVAFEAGPRRLTTELHLRLPGMRDLDLSLRLAALPSTILAPQWMFLALALAPTRIEALELRYVDDDWAETERSLEAAATALGVPRRRDDVIAALEAQRAEIADDAQDGAKETLLASLDALERFLRQGGTLTLTLAPPRAVTFGELALRRQGNAVALAQLLGLSIR
ncbi:MAG TPA: hypothetical protein VLX85_11850 [Stellaceae bacterium]|nr:hypothetical protein [Stellaceae bacterium]